MIGHQTILIQEDLTKIEKDVENTSLNTFLLFVYFTWYSVRLAPFSHRDQGGITVIQSSYLMVSSGNNNFLTCTNGNRCIGNIKVLKFYLVVGTYVD